MLEERQAADVESARGVIERAGRTTHRLRIGLFVALMAAVIPLPLLAPIGGPWLPVIGWVAGALATGFAVLSAFLYRRARTRRMRALVITLRPSEWDDLFASLETNEYKDVGKIAAALTRALPPSGREPLPASAPDGTGTEAVAVTEGRDG